MRIKTVFVKISDAIDEVEKTLCFVLLFICVVIGLLQVIFRFIHQALPWSEEFLRFCFIYLTFMGAGLGFKTAAHLSVEFFTSLLPKNINKILSILVFVLIFIFVNQVFLKGLTVVSTAYQASMKSSAMQIPMWIPYLGVCLPFFFMQFQVLAAACRTIWPDKKAEEDNA